MFPIPMRGNETMSPSGFPIPMRGNEHAIGRWTISSRSSFRSP